MTIAAARSRSETICTTQFPCFEPPPVAVAPAEAGPGGADGSAAGAGAGGAAAGGSGVEACGLSVSAAGLSAAWLTGGVDLTALLPAGAVGVVLALVLASWISRQMSQLLAAEAARRTGEGAAIQVHALVGDFGARDLSHGTSPPRSSEPSPARRFSMPV